MKRRKKRRPPAFRAPRLTERQILDWIDAWRRRTGTWPKRRSGTIPGTLGETWIKVCTALRCGLRGLPGGSSLTRLLEERRGVRNDKHLPPYTIAGIVAWARQHHRVQGSWPTEKSGSIRAAPGETWIAVTSALRNGGRGLPGGSSLARVLAEHLGVPNEKDLPRLSEKQILAWADAEHASSGHWPTRTSGPITGVPGENWEAVDMALRVGVRGLFGGSSLAQLLARERGVRNKRALPRLTLGQVRAWARQHYLATGRWPSRHSGPVACATGETWSAINMALRVGCRGFPGGSSLARVLGTKRAVRGSERR
jgi:hypothetical protein